MLVVGTGPLWGVVSKRSLSSGGGGVGQTLSRACSPRPSVARGQQGLSLDDAARSRQDVR